jgi:predicted amidohydrolase
MDKPLSLATLQLDITPAPLAERLARAETLVVRAAQAGARLIALPELFNTGYVYRDENFARAEVADGPTAAWMKQISVRLGVHLAGSLLLRDGAEIYNALLLYAPDGRCWRYDKNYPWGWERAYFREGQAVTVAETELGHIGLLLCWDMAHADLWRQYAGKVDLMLACSCPPDISDPTYHFPDGSRVTAVQMGPVYANLRQAGRQAMVVTATQQAAWLGVPFVGSTGCGVFRSPIPNPAASFMGSLPVAPWLIRYLPQIGQLELSASMVEAACILSADGRPLAALRNGQGEAFALAQVSLPATRPQPRGPQPKPPVPTLVYLVSDKFLTGVSVGTYARRNRAA